MSKKRKTSLWNRLEDSLGEPRDLAGPLKEVNSILRVKQTPMTYKTLHGILENHGVRVGALHGIGRFIDFLCFVDIAQGYPSPACMFETATGRIGTRLADRSPEKIEEGRREFIDYWRRARVPETRRRCDAPQGTRRRRTPPCSRTLRRDAVRRFMLSATSSRAS
jgi:hypothetical protein